MESPTSRALAQQYDHFQSSMEAIDKDHKYLNYGYTVKRSDSYEERQERLCTEVFQAAEIESGDVIVDVGFGSGEQDFLLLRTRQFAELHGFNIAERQVQYATERARETTGGDKLHFHHGEAENMPGMEPASADKMMAIECAFYFDRPRFYRRAAEVLKPGGRLVLADISFSDNGTFLMGSNEGRRRVGTLSGNRREWEKYFRTVSITDISRQTRPGAQMSVNKILRTAPFGRFQGGEKRAWLSMAYGSQIVVIGLLTGLLRYDLIVLERS